MKREITTVVALLWWKTLRTVYFSVSVFLFVVFIMLFTRGVFVA